MSPRPSIGWPSGLTTRPRKASPTGTESTSPGALDLLALFDLLEVTEDDGADAVLVEVQRDTEHAAGELEQLLGHDRGQALDVGDAVTGIDDGADLFTLGVGGERGYVVLDGTFDVSSGDCQLCHVFRLPTFDLGW